MNELLEEDLIQRLKALGDEALMLKYFWVMVRGGAERVPLLEQMGRVIVPRPDDWDFGRIRSEHEKNRPLPSGDPLKCFVCSIGGRLYHHHILEVHHGGSNNGFNLVPLCFPCHKRLHPWIEEPPETTGWTLLRDIAKTVKWPWK